MKAHSTRRGSLEHIPQSGFSLIEVLLVVGISSLLVFSTLPLGMRFFGMEHNEETAFQLFSTLTRARQFAWNGKEGSAWGVKFFSNHYVLFKGESYDSRTASSDEFSQFDGAMHPSESDEVVFASLYGTPNAPQQITVSNGKDEFTVSLAANGLIEIE